MKKSVAVIALDPFSGKAYARQVQSVFGDRVLVRNYSVMDGTVANMEICNLYMGSTDAFDALGDLGRYIPSEAERMEIQVTYRRDAISRLENIPQGTKALFVNISEVMAREAVTQLEQLGVTHLKFIIYAPGSQLTEAVDIAVTPDEERYVPAGITTVINLGQRACSADTMIEAAIRLDFNDVLESVEFKQYQQSICTNTYYFDQMLNRSVRLESQFDILMEVLDQGVIAVNESGKIYAINKHAVDITQVPEQLSLNNPGEEVFPYIPFRKCLMEKRETSPQVVKVSNNMVSMYVRPVLRRDNCIGAFAILQKFNEMERRQNELRGQLMKKGQGHQAKYCFDDVIGESEAILKTKEILKKMALAESPVLLIGATGTGKELFAHSVHQASRRCKQPFVAINCAAMPENLLESELFGYVEGAFTGAKKGGRPGLFEFAHQGTLFLDEVEGMSPALQVKLLRVLQEREVMRVGGNQIIHVDVRIVAATNEELEEKVANGSFRQDLYYRLNALPVLIPTLSQRSEDVFLLLEQFKKEIGGQFQLSDEIRRLFRQYEWPGNIRELRNVVEYLCFTGHAIVSVADLPPVFLMNKIRQPLGIQKGEVSGNQASEIPNELERAVLEILYQAERTGQTIGREKIQEEAGQFVKVTQPQVRKILNSLAKRGYVEINRGRGGSHITKQGIEWITK